MLNYSEVINWWYVLLAVGINIVFKIIKPFLKVEIIPIINKVLPKNLDIITEEERTGFYWLVIIFMSMGVFWLMKKYDTVKLVENSIVISALALSAMSIFFYTFGIKILLPMIKRKFGINDDSVSK